MFKTARMKVSSFFMTNSKKNWRSNQTRSEFDIRPILFFSLLFDTNYYDQFSQITQFANGFEALRIFSVFLNGVQC